MNEGISADLEGHAGVEGELDLEAGAVGSLPVHRVGQVDIPVLALDRGNLQIATVQEQRVGCNTGFQSIQNLKI